TEKKNNAHGCYPLSVALTANIGSFFMAITKGMLPAFSALLSGGCVAHLYISLGMSNRALGV
ncbi:MAG: hypothetical protein RLZZ316_1239, partial [Bacteroidota bacterium]